MNIKSLILCACLAVVPSIAGKIVTYTATSTISQEDANNSAIAGVAKQVKSQITATQTLTKYEDITDGKSVLGETYRAKNNVKSNVVLKGVQVVPVKADKGFKATATLDMDEFTADLQFRLKTLKQEIANLEKSARKAIENRVYVLQKFTRSTIATACSTASQKSKSSSSKDFRASPSRQHLNRILN